MSGDYTLTPNLSLYKPNYALDVGQWGNHLNLNSDTLDAALGVVSAGAVNALNFGADPTGVANSSAAINAAAAVVGPDGRRKTVYLPTGTYRVDNQINLMGSQGLVGDTRGSSVLYVDDKFEPAAQAVIFCTSTIYDAGPVIRDLGITFQQPWDQVSRANFKTLAAGGTSSPGGTGVKYPWAIASGTDSFRIQIARVRIGGAWDGITSNGHNTVFWLNDVEMGALDCGISLGEGAAGIQDFCHISGYHFWTFEMGAGALVNNVFFDGQAVALRVGRCDGLNIRDFSSFCGRLIVTPDAAGFTAIHIANCMMDSGTATIEINGAMLHFNISNMYGVSGAERPRPMVQINATCNMNIVNLYSHCTATYSDFLLTSPDAKLTVNNFRSAFYPTGTYWAEVRQGFLRIVNGYLYLGGPRTVAAIAETSAGILLVDDVLVQGSTPSGPLISAVSNTPLTKIGNLALEGGHAWTVVLPPVPNHTFYSRVIMPALQVGATFTNDAAAAAAGVAIGQLYRNGSVVQVRVA